MRARNIKPGLWKDEDLAALPMEARYLFPGLWCMADCKGRLEDRPRWIKSEIFGYDDAIGAAKVHHLLQLLDEAGFIRRYEIAGNHYIQVVNFEKHQNPHKQERDKGSQIPEPPMVEVHQKKADVVPIKTEPHQNLTESVPVSTGVTRDDSGFLIPDSRFLIADTGKRKTLDPPKTDSPNEAKARTNWEAVNEAWKWYQQEYPSEVNTFIETQLFLSVMETDADLADLKRNLPIWKQTKKWAEGFAPSSKNFLSERIFKIAPKEKDTRRRSSVMESPVRRSATPAEEIESCRWLIQHAAETQASAEEISGWERRIEELGANHATQ